MGLRLQRGTEPVQDLRSDVGFSDLGVKMEVPAMLPETVLRSLRQVPSSIRSLFLHASLQVHVFLLEAAPLTFPDWHLSLIRRAGDSVLQLSV